MYGRMHFWRQRFWDIYREAHTTTRNIGRDLHARTARMASLPPWKTRGHVKCVPSDINHAINNHIKRAYGVRDHFMIIAFTRFASGTRAAVRGVFSIIYTPLGLAGRLNLDSSAKYRARAVGIRIRHTLFSPRAHAGRSSPVSRSRASTSRVRVDDDLHLADYTGSTAGSWTLGREGDRFLPHGRSKPNPGRIKVRLYGVRTIWHKKRAIASGSVRSDQSERINARCTSSRSSKASRYWQCITYWCAQCVCMCIICVRVFFFFSRVYTARLPCHVAARVTQGRGRFARPFRTRRARLR